LPNTWRSSTSSPFDVAELAAHVDDGLRRQIVGELVGRAVDHRLEVDRQEQHLLGPREVEEVRHHVTERLGLLADAGHVGAVGGRQIVGANQAAVAMDRRQPVAELVGDAAVSSPTRASASFSRS
jgi:hypothetical protein